jgi:hypothetical protein
MLTRVVVLSSQDIIINIITINNINNQFTFTRTLFSSPILEFWYLMEKGLNYTVYNQLILNLKGFGRAEPNREFTFIHNV